MICIFSLPARHCPDRKRSNVAAVQRVPTIFKTRKTMVAGATGGRAADFGGIDCFFFWFGIGAIHVSIYVNAKAP